MKLSKLSIFQRADARESLPPKPDQKMKQEIKPMSTEQMKEIGFLPRPINTEFIKVSKEKVS